MTKVDKMLFDHAQDLLTLMDKGADSMLPREIVDVVKLHSKLAVGSAWLPVPGADVAAGAATIWTMYARINNKIGLPFGENAMKSVASGVATNLVGYVAMSGVASALKFIPGIGTVGGAILLSASLYALTLTSGYIYLRALKYLAKTKGTTFSVDDIAKAIKKVLLDEKAIGDFFKESKQSYKK